MAACWCRFIIPVHRCWPRTGVKPNSCATIGWLPGQCEELEFEFMSETLEQLQVGNSSYAAVREQGAGLIDLSQRGRLLVSGAEAVPFLNGLITNDMKTLAVNSWMPAAFPNVQGRLIASVRV